MNTNGSGKPDNVAVLNNHQADNSHEKYRERKSAISVTEGYDNKGVETDSEDTDSDSSKVKDRVKHHTNESDGSNENQLRRRKFSWGGVLKAIKENKLAEKHRKENEIHIIDRISRYLFPTLFLIFNAFYFGLCLTQSGNHKDH